VFAPPLAARHSQFQPLLDASPTLVDALQKVTTIAQLLLLVPTSPSHTAAGTKGQQQQGQGQQLPPLLVANTHLFFHPFAPHIRTIHTAAILEEAAAAVECWQQGQALQVHPPSAEQQQEAATAAAGAAATAADATAAAPPTQQPQQQQGKQQQQGVSWVSPHAQELLAAAAGPPCLLFCGDLNSDLNDGVPGVVAMLGSGQLSADHWDWSYGKLFR
jgi:2',5'-phosphodiesterase